MNLHRSRRFVLQLAIFEEGPFIPAWCDSRKRPKKDFVPAATGRRPTRVLDCNRVPVQVESLAFRIRFNVLHFIDPRSNNMPGAEMTWKSRNEQARSDQGYTLASSRKESVHLRMDRPAKFQQLADTRFAKIDRKNTFSILIESP